MRGPEYDMTNRYRFLVRKRFTVWALFAVVVRIPNASAPLAMVFLGHGATGSYASGGTLAAAFVVGEVGGAALLGWLGREKNVRRDVSIGLAVGAVAFGLLAVGGVIPYWLLVGAAVLAGAGPAQSGGALRAALGRIVEDKDLARAYSVDSLISELVWLIAPALVVAAAVIVSPYAVLALSAALLVVGTVLAATAGGELLAAGSSTEGAQISTSRRPLIHAWPIYLTSAAALSLLAVAELVLPSLLEQRGFRAEWSGLLLAVFAGASALASIVYGLRTWFGSVRAQSTVFLIATAVALGAMALSTGMAFIGIALVLAGVCQSVVMITRNLSLRDELPPALHTSGFTFMYSVQGAGYAASAVLASAVLDGAGAPAAIGAGIAVMLVLTVVSVVADVSRRSARTLATSADCA
ncbi:hypothetical protein DEJ28_01135 [Curtobacterium sp. MCPF17_002]|uniref:MFS transporter n=1 Tax=Curtobacterium sp. MCPF17_002 TaxID=2175645 RepID=UPI0024E00658|nr:MFS transporter [Curtobacterium sp. MCPF17_002]WIB77726.1 hypothetical protein DEJ28_01135 [Curtobacterium sp. MCPF17_002]